MKKETKDKNSLAHTSRNGKYHIVFAPKYRRKVFFAEKRLGIRERLRKLCEWKGGEIIEGEVIYIKGYMQYNTGREFVKRRRAGCAFPAEDMHAPLDISFPCAML